MPLKSLNKIAAIFLVGATAVLFAIALYWNVAATAFNDSKHAALLAVLFVPTSALLGTILQSLSTVSLGKFLRHKAHSKKSRWIGFFAQTSQQKDMLFWKRMFLRIANDPTRYQWFKDFLESDDFKTSLPDEQQFIEHQQTSGAFGAFLRDAKAEEFEWFTQERGAWILSSSLAFTFGACIVYAAIAKLFGSPILVWLSGWQFFAALLGSFIPLWALCSFALARYLFEYEIVLRHMCLQTAEADTQKDSKKGLAANG